MIDVNALEKQIIALDKGARKVDAMLSADWGDRDGGPIDQLFETISEAVDEGNYGSALDDVRRLRRKLGNGNGKANGGEGDGA